MESNKPASFTRFISLLKQLIHSDMEIQTLSPGVFSVTPVQYPVGVLFYCTTNWSLRHLDRKEIGQKWIHLDEDLFVTKEEIVMNRIKALYGFSTRIYARETKLKRVDKKTALHFQELYHLQVALPGKYRYGLFYQEELLSLAVFSGGRKMHSQPTDYRSFELLRFCHKADLLVVGGLSKLIKGFIRDFHPGDIMTYVDRDWSDGRNYQPLGFVVAGDLEPQALYIRKKDGTRTYDVPDEPYTIVTNLGSVKMRFIV